MANANTEHSKALRAASSRAAQKKARDEGRKKAKTLVASPAVIDEFTYYLQETGEKTIAKQLEALNKKLRCM